MQRSLLSLYWLAPVLGTLGSPALAGGTMFRCGSSYQDRPCDAGQPAKVIGGSGVVREHVSASSPAPVASAGTAVVVAPRVDAECAAQGNRAKQIVWAKESGRTADVQLAAATSDDDRRLITDVYRRRGSALDVRSGVEADCMAAKVPTGAQANLCQVLKGQMDADPASPNSTKRQSVAKAWRDAGC
ncbi:MAG: hypothetical protein EOP36_07525 [Rubrivivax sp.]|nr:MAG: hypothetical protein EOP36_07525 [Rubrivivax sp.]